MKFTLPFFKNFFPALIVISLSSCRLIPSEVILHEEGKGVTKVPLRFAFHATLGDSKKVIQLPRGDIISMRREKAKANSNCYEEYLIERYDTVLKKMWSVPIPLDCKRDKLLGITVADTLIHVLKVRNLPSDTVSATETNSAQLYAESISLETGTVGSGMVLKEFDTKEQVKFSTFQTDSLFLVYYTGTVTETRGTAQTIVLNNSARIISLDEIPFTSKTLPLKIDGAGNVYAVSLLDKEQDTTSRRHIPISALKKERGNPALRQLSVRLPLREWVGYDLSSFNTDLKWYDYSVTPEHDIDFTAQSCYKNAVAGYTGALFAFSRDTVFKTIDIVTYDQKLILEQNRYNDFFMNNKVIGKYHLPDRKTALVLEEIDSYFYSHSHSSGGMGMRPAITTYYTTGPYEVYGSHQVFVFDEAGNIVWRTFLNRAIEPGPEEFVNLRETTARSLFTKEGVSIFYRDRTVRNGFTAYSVRLADGKARKMEMPFFMENYGNGVLLEQDKSILLPDGKAILFTKNWQTVNYGDMLKIDFTAVPLEE